MSALVRLAAAFGAAVVLSGATTGPAVAGSAIVEARSLTEWKAVYGRVEARETIPARARIGGTLVALAVTEGDFVKAGTKIATVRDDKIAFQIDALDAQLRSLAAQLANAESELARGKALVERGVVTTQRLDQLATQADVLRGQIAATEAQRRVQVQQGVEGDVTAPVDGRVLTVPVTRGAVVMPGETMATIGGGGFFLRLAVPERHAATLKQGAALAIETGGGSVEGRLKKLYPQIANGRVIADVEVADLPTDFVDARVLVRLPVGTRRALTVPATAITTRSGLDLVRVKTPAGEVERAVVLGGRDGVPGTASGADQVEILSGLDAGEEVVTP
jgi:RND family efflux transporter MFP subunit